MLNLIELEKYNKCLQKLRLEEMEYLFVANDMSKFGLIENNNKNASMDMMFEELIKINTSLTIVFPTASLNLVNNETVFDITRTPSHKMGAFSEHLRKKSECHRSLHPFWSVSAIGPKAKELTSSFSKNPYDKNSVFDKLFNNTHSYFMALGKHPRFMLSVIHYIEYISNVKYRFLKNFKKKIIDLNRNEYEDTYQLFVLKEEYRNLERSKNKLIFINYESKGNLKYYKINESELYIFNLREFFEITLDLFKKKPDCYWF